LWNVQSVKLTDNDLLGCSVAVGVNVAENSIVGKMGSKQSSRHDPYQ